METSKEVFLRHIPEAVDLQMIDAKQAQVTLRNGTTRTQRWSIAAKHFREEALEALRTGAKSTQNWYKHSIDDRASRPLFLFNKTGRVFVCITGQVKRLVPMHIKETILQPLRNRDMK